MPEDLTKHVCTVGLGAQRKESTTSFCGGGGASVAQSWSGSGIRLSRVRDS